MTRVKALSIGQLRQMKRDGEKIAMLTCYDATFARAMSFADSPNHGIAFCTGTFAEAGATPMMAALTRFAKAGRIHYVHLRSVAGELPRFAEAFIDEGSVDPVAVLRVLGDAVLQRRTQR